jgi:hypothetical protein
LGVRIIVLLAFAALIGCLWYVGLNEAAEFASILGGVAAAATLVIPYVFPPQSNPVTAVAAGAAGSGAGQLGIIEAELAGRIPSAGTTALPNPGGMPPGPAASENQAAPASAKAILTEAMMDFGDMEDPDFRRLVLRSMGDRLRLDHPFSAPYRAAARDHVVGIVDRIWEFKDPDAARRALAESLEYLRPDDGATVRLKSLI